MATKEINPSTVQVQLGIPLPLIDAILHGLDLAANEARNLHGGIVQAAQKAIADAQKEAEETVEEKTE